MPKLSSTQQDERRARILDAAEICFARTGFHRTTMQDICREAGISAGALYLYFDAKEALIAGIVERDRQDVLSRFAALEHEPDMLAGLQNVMRGCIIDRPRHKSVLIVEIGAEGTRNPAIARIIAECDAAIRASLLGLLERAVEEGRLTPTVPPQKLVPMLELLADGMFWRRAIQPDFDANAVMPVILASIGPLLGARPETPGHPALAPRSEIAIAPTAGEMLA